MYCKVDDIIMYVIVACNDKTSIRLDQQVTHQKSMHATVKFILEVRGFNVLVST